MRILVTFLAIGVFLAGCKNSAEEKCAFIPDTSGININIKVEQLEDSVTRFSSKKEMVDFFSRNTELRDVFFNRTSYPDDSVFINELYSRFNNPYFDSLLIDTHRVFGDLSELKRELNEAFANLIYYYPNFEPPKVQTVITGLESDIYVSDSLVIIGLDYYLGPGARYKPNMYDYMLKRYQKNFIVPSIMLLYGIDDQFNKTNLEDRTVLADMISYGKTYYFAKQMLPCVPDSVFIGYTKEEMRGSRDNSDLIWKRLVEDEVFYSTSHLIKQRYIAERPKTLEVGEKCPGRIATWVGWEVVKKYMDQNKNITLPQLMGNPSAGEIFKASGYKPM
ncbi:MAG: gliding motility lipoprotein GldB [Cyclobacteriaceae bacterium]|nr:gliding motility lipoprotein GldB [Cyclobacteriaceae bacterium]